MRVVVVDDHEIVREGLRRLLPTDPAISVVAEAASAAAALIAVRRTAPEVVVVDFRLPGITGAELCRRILEIAPRTQVVILSAYLSTDVVQACRAAGAAAYVSKASGLEELRGVLARLAARPGAAVQDTEPAEPGERPLTPQQRRVLELTAAGLTTLEIAERLAISEFTVRFHVRNLKKRFDARTKPELVALAIRSTLISGRG